MRARAWRLYLLMAALATGGYFLLSSLAARDIAYDALGLTSVIAILVGVRLNRPSRPAPWYLFAAGLFLFVAGDFTFSLYEVYLHVKTPFPSVADVFYLAGYPVITAGLFILIRGRTPGRDRAGLIDAVIIAVGLGVLSWVYLMVPYARDPSLSILERAVSIAYPLADVLLVAMAARLMVTPGSRTGSYRMLAVSLFLLLGADVVYATLSLRGGYYSGHPIDAGWLLSYALWGAAALHPSMRTLSEPAPAHDVKITRLRLAFLAGASLLPPGVLAIQAARGGPVEAPVVAAGSALLFLLVTARLAGLTGDLASKAEQLKRKGSVLEATLTDLRQVEGERALLLERTVRVAEDERTKIAADLHDGPIQRLAMLELTVGRIQGRLERGEVHGGIDLLTQAEKELSGEIHSLRQLMAELRPPALDERGLPDAIRDHVEEFVRRTGVQCRLEVAVDGRLEPQIETVLYRVAQEALANVAKHARASGARISLRTVNGSVVLEFQDDGAGFDPENLPALIAAGHYGLAAMRQRIEMAGGSWSLRTAPGAGTAIEVTFADRETVAA